jgi:hypothetical protein
MAQNLSLIGVQNEELVWIRLLVSLLRHPDPAVPELARQALLYVRETSGKSVILTEEPAARETA